MISKTFILICLLVNTFCSRAQSSSPTKEQLFTIFEESIRQDSKRTIQTHSNPWVICNDDSAYFKKDTLTLFRYSANYPPCSCNCYADWTFYRKNAFVVTFEHTQFSRVSATNKGSWYAIKLLEKKEGLVLRAKNNNAQIIQFRVLSAGETIVLKRLL